MTLMSPYILSRINSSYIMGGAMFKNHKFGNFLDSIKFDPMGAVKADILYALQMTNSLT